MQLSLSLALRPAISRRPSPEEGTTARKSEVRRYLSEITSPSWRGRRNR
jgi:hypothetical protein